MVFILKLKKCYKNTTKLLSILTDAFFFFNEVPYLIFVLLKLNMHVYTCTYYIVERLPSA